MATLKIRKFSTIEEAQFFLNGGIIGGAAKTAGGVYGLVGLTLTFTYPNAAVTFVAGADLTNLTLTWTELKTQIETAVAGVKVQAFGPDGGVGFIETTPTNGVALSSNDEPAKRILGFPQSGAVVGKVYKTPTTNTAPCLVAIYPDVQSNSHVVVTWE